MKPRLIPAALLVTVVGSLSCSSSKHPSGSLSGSVTVYAAASLKDTFTTLAKQFERAHAGTKVIVNFGPSSELATGITNGAPADVFASASAKNMTTVVSAGEAGPPRTFAKNTMEIATAPGNPAHVASVTDLGKRSVKVALCAPSVPCGALARQIFNNAHLTVRPVSLEADVKATLAKVELGEVDAGVVYVTDVKAAGARVVGVPIPAGINASTSYPIASLTHAKNPALAMAFADYVLSGAGRQVLAAAGFGSP
ncbi:MAG: molybdate ABC transporter substrate-binding protein [Jatrophihabitantaceae bacterium]